MTQSKPPSDEVEPYLGETAPSWLKSRPRRILAAGIVAAIVASLGVIAFIQFAPDSTVGTSPTAPATPGAVVESPAAVGVEPPITNDGPAVPEVTPVDIEEPGVVIDELSVQIIDAEAVDGVARGPGEVAGPSVRVTVTVTNASLSEVTLRTAVVSCYFGPDLTPAQELREPGGRPLPEAVKAKSSVDGVYVFTIPADQRGNVTLVVDYSVDVVPLVFQGDLAVLLAD